MEAPVIKNILPRPRRLGLRLWNRSKRAPEVMSTIARANSSLMLGVIALAGYPLAQTL